MQTRSMTGVFFPIIGKFIPLRESRTEKQEVTWSRQVLSEGRPDSGAAIQGIGRFQPALRN